MPFSVGSILRANELFARLDDFEPRRLLESIGGAETVLDGAEVLGLFSVIDPDQADELRTFFGQVPPALDAAILAALRSALGRELRTQISWAPGYDFELRVWEVSAAPHGLLNIHIVSPHPPEAVST